ncbi:MAG: SufE family protein [Rhodoluna sp.]
MPEITPSATEILEAFNEVPRLAKLDLLLEYADQLPEIPENFRDRPELLERVEECQSPVYLITEIESNRVRVYLTAPVEAPTTRGFASILQIALDNQSVQTVIEFDDGFISSLGLTELVSPLRIRGMHGMLNRIKRQVSEKI